MNKSKIMYWESFYKKAHTLKPSSFAKFCLPLIEKGSKIIEFGCGNGRDTKFFGKKGFEITAVDYASQPKDLGKNVNFVKSDLVEYLLTNENKSDVLYSRFFLHSINNSAIEELLYWASGTVFLEFRAEDDVPILYPDHYRNNINENQLIKKMIDKGFDLIYYKKTRGIAVYKNEDPLIVRIIARKKICQSFPGK